MRPTDPAGFREAWDIVERLWAGTVERARRLDPALLHESVDGEWSFIETLRHLAFATDAWIRRAILGDPSPWDPLDLPWDEMPDTAGDPARPRGPAVARRGAGAAPDRMATVRTVVDGLTDESLAARTEPVDGPGWPPPRSFPVRECLLRRPQRGVVAPAVRRARPRRLGLELASPPPVPSSRYQAGTLGTPSR